MPIGTGCGGSYDALLISACGTARDAGVVQDPGGVIRRRAAVSHA